MIDFQSGLNCQASMAVDPIPVPCCAHRLSTLSNCCPGWPRTRNLASASKVLVSITKPSFYFSVSGIRFIFHFFRLRVLESCGGQRTRCGYSKCSALSRGGPEDSVHVMLSRLHHLQSSSLCGPGHTQDYITWFLVYKGVNPSQEVCVEL